MQKAEALAEGYCGARYEPFASPSRTPKRPLVSMLDELKIGPRIESLIEHLPGRELAFRFTVIFSRFEYAIKAGGFATGGAGSVRADWDHFAHKLPDLGTLDNEILLREAIAELRADPPRKQVLLDGNICWKTCDFVLAGNAGLFMMVRRIRNNLFHGGKTPFDDGRDARLLTNALIVLTAALALSDDTVREAFFEGGAQAAL